MNDVAAPQPAVTTKAGAQLEALRREWGRFYAVGFDAERGWWATRHGRIGHIVQAASAVELGAAVGVDLGAAA